MPLSLEPGQQFPIVLDSDETKPAATRPTFFARSQSMRGQLAIGKALDLYTSSPDLTVEQLFESTLDALMGVITGWKSMGDIAFSRDGMQDVLSFTEARELLRKVMYNRHLTDDEKKSSV